MAQGVKLKPPPTAALDPDRVKVFKKAVGARVKATRERARLSRSDLAGASGLSRAAIYKLEDGQGITLTTLLQVSQAMGVQPASLVPELMETPQNEAPAGAR